MRQLLIFSPQWSKFCVKLLERFFVLTKKKVWNFYTHHKMKTSASYTLSSHYIYSNPNVFSSFQKPSWKLSRLQNGQNRTYYFKIIENLYVWNISEVPIQVLTIWKGLFRFGPLYSDAFENFKIRVTNSTRKALQQLCKKIFFNAEMCKIHVFLIQI